MNKKAEEELIRSAMSFLGKRKSKAKAEAARRNGAMSKGAPKGPRKKKP